MKKSSNSSSGQLSLGLRGDFDCGDAPPPAHQPPTRSAPPTDPPRRRRLAATSLRAYRAVDLQGQYATIYDAVERAGSRGLTAFEVAAQLNLLAQSASGRLADLQTRGLIRPSGETRPSPHSGRACQVLVVTSAKEEASQT